MHMKTKGQNAFLEGLKKLGVFQRAAVALSVVVVVGGIGLTVLLLSPKSEPVKPVVTSSEPESFMSVDETSAEESSQETSSEATSSEETSSAETSSATSSKATSSKVTSSQPTISKPETTSETVTSETAVSSAPPVVPAGLPEGYQERFADLYKANKEVKGWIKLAGTKLDYPVVQGKDNSFYLNYNEKKQKSAWGVPYMDYRNSVAADYQSSNTILYGHSDDKRGLQLSATKGYRKIDFYKQHPTIEFDTVYADGTYKIVAFFIENTKQGRDFFQYHMFIDQTDEAYVNDFIANAKSRSYINTTVDVLPTDKFLTISTCQDTNPANYNRLVMVARKVRPGESAEVDTSGATQNTNQVLPK